MDKYTRAHNRMAMATGETKTRNKLSKSKHGWIKIAMGVTFASSALLMVNTTTFADQSAPQQPQAVVQPGNTDNSTGNSTNNPNDGSAAGSQETNPVAQSVQQSQQPDTDQNPQPDQPQATTPKTRNIQLNVQNQSGTYTLSGMQNVRDGASLSANVEGQLYAGDSINYDDTQYNDGYTWLHYNDNGQNRWIARMANANHDDFVNSIAGGAINTWNTDGVLPSVSIAQAIVESAWGASAPGNNLYGIKGEYNGNYTLQWTSEFVNGQYIQIQDKFRAYPDYAASIQDHGDFLAQNSRYSNLIANGDYAQVCYLLQADGYATDPNYANTLINIIERNNLSRFDNGIGNGGTGNGNNNQSNTNNNGGASSNDSGVYTLSGMQNVRNGASLSAGITGQLDAGDSISYNGTAEADGYTWLHYKNFAGADRWVAQMGNSVQIPSQPEQQPSQPSQPSNNAGMDNNSGAYTLGWDQNVRDDSSLSAGVTGRLDAGNTIYYDGSRSQDGYTWLHYKNFAGADRWVAQMSNATPQTPTQPEQQPSQPSQPSNNAGMDNNSGAYTLGWDQNVRDDSSLSAGVTGRLDAGNTIYYDGSRSQDGYIWLHYKNFAGADRWVAQMSNATLQTPTNNHETSSDVVAANGTYTLSGQQNVRDAGTINGGVTGQLNAGDSISYDGTKQADGYTWLHYKNYAGLDRWVAQLNLAFN